MFPDNYILTLISLDALFELCYYYYSIVDLSLKLYIYLHALEAIAEHDTVTCITLLNNIESTSLVPRAKLLRMERTVWGNCTEKLLITPIKIL